MAEVQAASNLSLEQLQNLLRNLASSVEEFEPRTTVDTNSQTIAEIWKYIYDYQTQEGWQENTADNMWSYTQVILSLSILLLIDREILPVNEKAAEHWPGYVAKGKRTVQIGQSLRNSSDSSGWNTLPTIENIPQLAGQDNERRLKQLVTRHVANHFCADLRRRVNGERQEEDSPQNRREDNRGTPRTRKAHDLNRSDKVAGLMRLYPETIPPHRLHPNACEFSVVDRGPIGKALITHRHWQQGDFMARFDGITVPEVMLHTLQKTDRIHLWDPYFIGNLAHSCNPNVMLDMVEHEIWAVQNIEPGSVLSMDYAATEDHLFRTFQCECTAPGCRGEITGRKQRRSHGYTKFSPKAEDQVRADPALRPSASVHK